MKILIAGGAGYIGSALIPRLQERGYTIDVIDLLWFGNFLSANVKVIKKDIFDLQAILIDGQRTAKRIATSVTRNRSFFFIEFYKCFFKYYIFLIIASVQTGQIPFGIA